LEFIAAIIIIMVVIMVVTIIHLLFVLQVGQVDRVDRVDQVEWEVQAELVELVAQGVPEVRNRGMGCLHNQPEDQTDPQVVEPQHLNCHHHLIILTEQVQIILHHLATGVVAGIAEEVEEVEDLVAVVEEAVVAEEDSELSG